MIGAYAQHLRPLQISQFRTHTHRNRQIEHIQIQSTITNFLVYFASSLLIALIEHTQFKRKKNYIIICVLPSPFVFGTKQAKKTLIQ